MLKIVLVWGALLFTSSLWARSYSIPADNSRLIGQNTTYTVRHGDTLASIANHFDIGFLALKSVNPGVDPFLPKPGTQLSIPLQMLLPEGPRQGIVVNLAQLRLFFYHPQQHKVDVFPIGIGRIGWDTPVTTTHISQKIPHPTWTPTANIRKEYAEKGIILPDVVPAGPENPLGDYAMRLAYGAGDYLIHGTNKDFGVGLRVSSGCIRLFPRDIEYLFSQASIGESVRIINQPIQYSQEPDGSLYLEVTRPLSKSEEDQSGSVDFPTNRTTLSFITQPGIVSAQLLSVLQKREGIPVRVGVTKKAP
ncbi:L,D-transpeptidase family protein [Celerinatantimonas sp. YJH-8]|uniref:L,D-transpeptidase family protein n=1 Tax=Celerinatantimonas sp. YJH-8 TaxID=3228714 RepID=UPI0038C01DA1